jgi:hypothetical protein
VHPGGIGVGDGLAYLREAEMEVMSPTLFDFMENAG